MDSPFAAIRSLASCMQYCMQYCTTKYSASRQQMIQTWLTHAPPSTLQLAGVCRGTSTTYPPLPGTTPTTG
jgi:hypothetical protein